MSPPHNTSLTSKPRNIEKLLYICLLTFIASLDQITKFIALQKLSPIKSYTVLDGLLNFTYSENNGAAFGILSDQRWLIISIAGLSILVIAQILLTRKLNLLLQIAISLISGGAIGNLIDRVRLGYVIDFVNIAFFPAIFNVADCFIVTGSIFLFIYLFTRKDDNII